MQRMVTIIAGVSGLLGAILALLRAGLGDATRWAGRGLKIFCCISAVSCCSMCECGRGRLQLTAARSDHCRVEPLRAECRAYISTAVHGDSGRLHVLQQDFCAVSSKIFIFL